MSRPRFVVDTIHILFCGGHHRRKSHLPTRPQPVLWWTPSRTCFVVDTIQTLFCGGHHPHKAHLPTCPDPGSWSTPSRSCFVVDTIQTPFCGGQPTYRHVQTLFCGGHHQQKAHLPTCPHPVLWWTSSTESPPTDTSRPCFVVDTIHTLFCGGHHPHPVLWWTPSTESPPVRHRTTCTTASSRTMQQTPTCCTDTHCRQPLFRYGGGEETDRQTGDGC